jgi:glutamate dehydrogenase
MQSAVRELTAAMGLSAGYVQPTDLEQAMLAVWSLSEGSSPDRLASGTAATTVATTVANVA